MSETRDVLVEVTQRHIDSGRARNCNSCPWATAISEHLNLAAAVQVGGDTILFTRIGKQDYYCLQPPEMFEWIEVFDGWREGDVAPTSATIAIPVWALKEPNDG